ncbi:hypothetical protein M5E06_20830 [Azospirillum sp. A1-3]|uniref:hypothetical protein n=1 Tax=Azospirillum sp. A1-3 TaxID=185874 RepID=UPI0020775EF5|nr:hypothetical protein [Azospirillum sp. A1-3]MCM8736576.1 hypothetical protein [Azospirillum sp. A1-3]
MAALRRALRDVRDREAGKSRRWLDVGFGGVVVGDSAWLVVLHDDRLDRQEVTRVVRRRWPGAQVLPDMSAPLTFDFNTDDLVELALARRGGEEIFKLVVGLRQIAEERHQRDAGGSVMNLPMPFIW